MGAAPSSESLDDRCIVSRQDHLDELHTDLTSQLSEALWKLAVTEELRHDHVMTRQQVRTGKGNREIASDYLGFVSFVPLTEVGADRIDVEDQRKRFIGSKSARERRLSDAGRAVDDEQHFLDRTATPAPSGSYGVLLRVP
jgi:hypothetical protein